VDKDHPVVRNIVAKLGTFKTVHKFFGEARLTAFPPLLAEQTAKLEEVDRNIRMCQRKEEEALGKMRHYQASAEKLKADIHEQEEEREGLVHRVLSFWDQDRLRTTTRLLGLHKVLGGDYHLTLYPREHRAAFKRTVNDLLSLPPSEFDKLRKHHVSKKNNALLTTLFTALAAITRQPPHYRGVLFMLSDKDWNIQHETSPRNTPEDLALLVKDKIGQPYTCKLAWLLENWDLYNFATPEAFGALRKHVQPVLYNPRISRENIKLMKKSKCVGPLIDLCQHTLDYVVAAQLAAPDVWALEAANNHITFQTTRYMDQKRELTEAEREVGRCKKAVREARAPRLDVWAKKTVLEELLAEVEEARRPKEFQPEMVLSKDGAIQVEEIEDDAKLAEAYGRQVVGYTGGAVSYFGVLKEIDQRLAGADLFDMVDYANTAEGDVAIVQSSLALSDVLLGANWDRTEELLRITTKYEVGELREAYVKAMARHQSERELWTEIVQKTYTRTLNAFEKFQDHLPPRDLDWYIDFLMKSEDAKHIGRNVKNIRLWLKERSTTMHEVDYSDQLDKIEEIMDELMEAKADIIEEAEELDIEFETLEKEVESFRTAGEEVRAAAERDALAAQGWTEVSDPGGGPSYWQNAYTGEQTWESPARYLAEGLDPYGGGGYQDQQGQQWFPAMSQGGGVYFQNQSSGQVAWDPPF